ncbi:hypothetical protein KFL_006530050 [Klebsormidium nitens]|uniref:WW domain-containing protein n=1 Tax=Klebsormidium nitens TaxID=105231 RepID=A0A1Y1IM68_KLENI|nr:hypothetical protein KFL_006530050 [Klebsormidium nitens]|eukprot:GAQ90539.1 hypothetical protein KFL_006530050 [Klebsormidium nitens]
MLTSSALKSSVSASNFSEHSLEKQADPILARRWKSRGTHGSSGGNNVCSDTPEDQQPSSPVSAQPSPGGPPPSNWGPFVPGHLFFIVCQILLLNWTRLDTSVIFLLAFYTPLLFMGIAYGLQEDAKKGQFLPRQPGLPPHWHNLYDPTQNRTFFYNSRTKVAQWALPGDLIHPSTDVSRTSDELLVSYFLQGARELVASIFKLLGTVGLYVAHVLELAWSIMLLWNILEQSWVLQGLLPVACLALPQPLPAVILLLGTFPVRLVVDNVSAQSLRLGWEALLCAALLFSLVPEVRSLLATLKRAARARLSPCKATGDVKLLTDFLCALCPGLGWRLRPFALRLSFDRFVLVPLPFRVPLPVPVPAWDLLPRSGVAVLHGLPFVLPLVKALVAARKGDLWLTPGAFAKSVILTPSVLVGVFAALTVVFIRRKREAYAIALERVKGAQLKREKGDEVVLEDLETKVKRDFDERLGFGDSLFSI